MSDVSDADLFRFFVSWDIKFGCLFDVQAILGK